METIRLSEPKPPGRMKALGKKSIAVTLSVLLILSTFSFSAFAEEADAQGTATDPVVVQDDQSTGAIAGVDASAIVAPQGTTMISPMGFSPLALSYLDPSVTRAGSTMTLEWEEVTDAVSYVIERGYVFNGSPDEYSTIMTQNTVGYVDYFVPDPASGKPYTAVAYRVTAYSANNGVIDQKVVTQFVEAIPVVPVVAAPKSLHSIELTWSSVSEAKTYTIYRSLTPNGPYVKLDSTTGLSYENTGLSPEVTYYYRVVATGEFDQVVGESGLVSAVIPYPIPSNVVAQATSTSSIDVTWDAMSGVFGYLVYRGLSETGPYVQVNFSFTPNYTDTGLQENTDYYYKVAILDASGVGPLSDFATDKTWLSVPGKTQNVNATALNSSDILITWDPVAKAETYNVYSGLTPTTITNLVGSTAGTNLTNTGLLPDTTYYYRVEAVNSAGVGELSDVAQATTGKTYPGKPANVDANALSTSSIQVDWDADSNATGYMVYRSSTADGTYSVIGVVTTNSFVDINLTSDTLYFYKVAAYNGFGFGPLSDYASARTHAILTPEPPFVITATALSSSSIQVNWSSVATATGYNVYRSLTAAGPYAYVGASTTTGYTDTGLNAETTYYYKVASTNSHGAGDLSVYAYATTKPAGPVAPPFWLTNNCCCPTKYAPKINFAIYPNTMEKNYRVAIYRATSPNGPYTKIYTCTPKWPGANKKYSYKLYYNDKSCFPKGTTLYYKVAAIDITGVEGPQSDYLTWTVGLKEKYQTGKGAPPADLGKRV